MILQRKKWKHVLWCLTEENGEFFIDRYENNRLVNSFGPTNRRAATVIFETYPEDKTP